MCDLLGAPDGHGKSSLQRLCFSPAHEPNLRSSYGQHTMKDGSGEISRKELEDWVGPRLQALKLSPPTGSIGFADEIMKKADDDKDGELSMDEVTLHKEELEFGHYAAVLFYGQYGEDEDEETKEPAEDVGGSGADQHSEL